MSQFGQRMLPLILFAFSGFMLWGGAFFWRELLPDNVTRTNTYTLYHGLSPPPVGPRFCPFLDTGTYGFVGPCDFQPPFVWWLEKRYREKNYTIRL